MLKSGITILLAFQLTMTSAWGPTGHRAIGLIAETHLHPKVKKKIMSLLSGESLAMASTWMDEIRSDKKYDDLEDWHWVTMPDDQSYEKAEKNPKGDIITAIQKTINELKSGKLSEQAEVEKIKILIHLVGDIHQPLHVGTGTDKGGNDLKVKWFGRNSNLHRVWDSDIIDHTKLSFTELAESLRKPTRLEIADWQSSDVMAWTRESKDLRNHVYDIGNGNLGYPYIYKSMDTVRRRLLEAGIRLAGVLNEIYG